MAKYNDFDELQFSNEAKVIKTSNQQIIDELQGMATDAQDPEMQKDLESVLEEFCNKYHFCGECFDALEHRYFSRGYEQGWYCANCETVTHKQAI